ncbi:MAG: hypothetical protein ACYCYO_18685 [Bacilli bacterium]
MSLSTSVFGYRRTEVDRTIASLKDDSARMKAELERSRARIEQLQGDLEEYKVTVATLRRQRVDTPQGADAAVKPLTLMIGPTDTLGIIVTLVEDIETSPEMMIRFRVFRDGFYRIDGYTKDYTSMIAKLQNRSDIRSLTVNGETLHIMPKGKSA